MNEIELNLWKSFSKVFEPIPHIDDLPMEPLAQITLKESEKTIKTKNYTCPWKWKNTWYILLQQHLDAGHIHSLHAPTGLGALIIPKLDLWVLRYTWHGFLSSVYPLGFSLREVSPGIQGFIYQKVSILKQGLNLVAILNIFHMQVLFWWDIHVLCAYSDSKFKFIWTILINQRWLYFLGNPTLAKTDS